MLNTGDIAFMLAASGLVMLMTPGLALFYGGLVRNKNVLNMLLQNFICLGIITIIWISVGYTLCFGPDLNGIIGNLSWSFLNNVGLDAGPYAPTIPHLLFAAFQLMFAIITPALITGAFAERIKFSAFIIFTILWTICVYFPVCHWIWGGGWLAKLGVVDFAGGAVIHISAGVSALVAAIMVGKRKGYQKVPIQPHNLPMTVLGAGLLWFGWFGFNGGSALAANQTAVLAFLNTHISSAVAATAWTAIEWIKLGKPTTLGAVTGAIAGLAAITPAAGFVGPMAAAVIGLAAGCICYLAVILKEKLGYDDSLDVFGVHGVGGFWGTIATGIFASTAWNPQGINGLFRGDAHQLGVQILAAVVVAVFSVIASIILLKCTDLITGLRVTEEEEEQGLDLSLHSEKAYVE